MSNRLDEILAPWVGFVHSEYDGTSMVDDELAVIATAKQQIQALITEARIDELEHVKPDVDGKAYVSTQNNPHMYISLKDRLTQLKEKK